MTRRTRNELSWKIIIIKTYLNLLKLFNSACNQCWLDYKISRGSNESYRRFNVGKGKTNFQNSVFFKFILQILNNIFSLGTFIIFHKLLSQEKLSGMRFEE